MTTRASIQAALANAKPVRAKEEDPNLDVDYIGIREARGNYRELIIIETEAINRIHGE